MKTIHLIYPHRPIIAAPHVIGHQLGKRLEAHYKVRYYDWDSFGAIKPGKQDILLGHPHPNPFTLFTRSIQLSGWHKKIALFPYNGDPIVGAFLNPYYEKIDHCCLITGKYWLVDLKNSHFAHITPRVTHLDLAVDTHDFPFCKTHFNSIGQRKILYIGHDRYEKNPRYLEAIAKHLPHVTFMWIGAGKSLAGYQKIGPLDFSLAASREIIKQADFTLTVGERDANPTTILESMAWGLIPICTPTSGYFDVPTIFNVPLNDVAAAVAQIKTLLQLPASQLQAIQKINLNLLGMHYHWDRFAAQIIQCIESTEPILPLLPQDPLLTQQLQHNARQAPHYAFKPRNFARLLYDNLKRCYGFAKHG